MILLNLVLVVTVLMVPFAHRINAIAGGLLIIVAEYAALLGFGDFFSRDGGAQLQYIIAAAACFVIFDLKRIRLIALLVLLALVLHLCVWFWFPATGRVGPDEQAVANSLYVQGAVTTFVLIAASVWYAFSLVERAKAETDAVLRNVLPDAIVERLKAKPGVAIADSIDQASVMFADISGFVALTLRLGADKTVELLSRIVSEFDALAVRHGVEKIKTIGDAYMVVAGLPDPVPDHTARLARMALDMLEVQLRRVGRAREPGEPARRAGCAGAHPRLPDVPCEAHRHFRVRAARAHRHQGDRIAGDVVSRVRAPVSDGS
jgi:adenylate cyclase